jgi:hypothetical protein
MTLTGHLILTSPLPVRSRRKRLGMVRRLVSAQVLPQFTTLLTDNRYSLGQKLQHPDSFGSNCNPIT